MCVAVPVGGGSVYCEVLVAGSSEGSFSTQLLCSIQGCDYAAHLTVQGHIQVRTHKVLRFCVRMYMYMYSPVLAFCV